LVLPLVRPGRGRRRLRVVLTAGNTLQVRHIAPPAGGAEAFPVHLAFQVRQVRVVGQLDLLGAGGIEAEDPRLGRRRLGLLQAVEPDGIIRSDQAETLELFLSITL